MKPSWFQEYVKSVPFSEIPDDIVEWIQAGPPDYQKMMLKFPPLSVVEAKIPLKIPSPGLLGTVVNVDHESIYVIEGEPATDDNAIKQVGQCRPEWLNVVGYWQGLTPERVAKIIRAQMEMP